MPHRAPSLRADPPPDAAGPTAAHPRPVGFDPVYEVDIEVLRGCRQPLMRHAAGGERTDDDQRTARSSGAR
jgi:hypothetical protein